MYSSFFFFAEHFAIISVAHNLNDKSDSFNTKFVDEGKKNMNKSCLIRSSNRREENVFVSFLYLFFLLIL